MGGWRSIEKQAKRSFNDVKDAVDSGLVSLGLKVDDPPRGSGQGRGRLPGSPGDYEWDLDIGLPVGFVDFPDAERALEFQAYNTRFVAERNARLRRDAMNYLRQGRTLTESFRPGGASSLMQGNYRALAEGAFASQIAETDMLARFREQAGEDATRRAEKAAVRQNRMDLFTTVAATAAGGPAALAAPALLGGGESAPGGQSVGYDVGAGAGVAGSGVNQSTLPGAAAGADVGTNRLPGAQAGASVGTAPGVAPAVVSPEGEVGTVGQGEQQNRSAGGGGQEGQRQGAYDLSGDIALVMHIAQTGSQFDSFVDTITKGMLARKAGILAEVM